MLKSCPDLTPVVLPGRWEKARSVPWQVKTELDLTHKEIRAAFSRLIRNRNLYKKHCFCFFIDGLDEYEETSQEDYKVMVDLLCSWTAAAPEDVKICVSSREYNVFLNAFSDERRLRLQDLTREDMERYIRDKLKGPSDEKLEHLVRLITDKGNGIFLWVALVVKTLRERLEDGHKLAALEKEIDSLPDELEGLFEYLLKSVGKQARKKMYQIFGMIQKLKPYGRRLTLLCYSFLEDYENDPEFAIRTSFSHSNMSDAVTNSRIDLARRKVNGYCRGFLDSGQDISTLGFTHRSISEFLEKSEVQKDMEFHLRGFDTVDTTSQLLLAEIRSKSRSSIPSESLSLTVYAIIDLRIQNKTDQAPYYFRECLSNSVLQHKIPETTIHSRTSLRISGSTFYIIGKKRGKLNYLTSPLEVSAFHGDYEYTTWKIKQDGTAIDTDYKSASLLCWIELGRSKAGAGGAANLKLVDFLLRRGLPPQRVIHTSPEVTIIGTHARLSFWQHFIYYIIDHCCRVQGQETGSRQMLGDSIETFLQYGADPQLIISISDKLRDLVISSSVGTSILRGGIEINFGREGIKIADYIHYTTPDLRFIATQGGKVSFREMIEFWAFDNQETILQLFDRNIQGENQASETRDHQQPTEKKDATQDLETLRLEPTLQLEPDVALKETEEEREVGKEGESTTALNQDFKGFGSWLKPANWSPVITFLLGEHVLYYNPCNVRHLTIYIGILLGIVILRLL
jgi:hypothetical protein